MANAASSLHHGLTDTFARQAAITSTRPPMRLLMSALFACTLAGCGSIGDPGHQIGRPLPIEYGSTQFGGGEKAPPGATEPPTVTASRGRLDVLGLIDLGTPCHELDAGLLQTGATLLVTVRVTPVGEVCVQVVDQFAYRTWIEGLPSGAYQVVVEYVARGSEQRRRAAAVAVIVP